MKIRSDSISAVTAKAERPIHGADRFDLPCSSSSPSEGEPGGMPSPRKSSEVSVLIDELTMNGRKVSVATIAFGSTCLTMILALERPSARAALTYSKLRARRNSARTTWTRLTQEKSKQDRQQHEEARRQNRRQNDENVEMGQRRPDLDHPLHHEVEPAAEIALHRAGEDADHRRNAGEDEAEQHRDAEAVEEARDDVVAVLIGAEP